MIYSRSRRSRCVRLQAEAGAEKILFTSTSMPLVGMVACGGCSATQICVMYVEMYWLSWVLE